MYIGLFYNEINSLTNFQNSLEKFTARMALRAIAKVYSRWIP